MTVQTPSPRLRSSALDVTLVSSTHHPNEMAYGVRTPMYGAAGFCGGCGGM